MKIGCLLAIGLLPFLINSHAATLTFSHDFSGPLAAFPGCSVDIVGATPDAPANVFVQGDVSKVGFRFVQTNAIIFGNSEALLSTFTASCQLSATYTETLLFPGTGVGEALVQYSGGGDGLETSTVSLNGVEFDCVPPVCGATSPPISVPLGKPIQLLMSSNSSSEFECCTTPFTGGGSLIVTSIALSDGTLPITVPEPRTILLVGLALVVLEFASRIFKVGAAQ